MGSLPNLHALSSADSEASLQTYLPRLGPHRLSAGHAPISYRPPASSFRPVEIPQPVHHEVPSTTTTAGLGYPSPMSTRSCHSVRSLSSRGASNYSRCGRRDSLTSSGGTSIRKLIAIVRATPSQFGPAFSERALARNHAALCLGHATFAAALIPLLALQSSTFNSELTGTILLSITFIIAAFTSLFTPIILQKLSPHVALIISYVILTLFFTLNLYSSIITLIPGYILFGITLGPLCNIQITILVNLAAKLSFVSEEVKIFVQARLARQFYLAHCTGHAIGSAVTGLVLWYTVTNGNTNLNFEHDIDGNRLCGSSSCPIIIQLNNTYDYFELSLPCKSSTMLYSIYLGCSVMAIAISATFLDKIPIIMRENFVERTSAIYSSFCMTVRSFKDIKLQLLTPLFIFIGFEQAFMMTDYSKSYVVCALGISHVSLALISMGILQAIAGCTLSLLLQHVPRSLVTVVGLLFHACLVMVLLLWRPSRDDAALFYVICAAWGVCNAIWETLSFAILSALYSETWQAPFAQSLFYRYIGLFIVCIIHPFVCIQTKLYLLVGSLACAVIGLGLLERRLVSRNRRHHSLRRASSTCSHSVKGSNVPI